MGMPKVQTTADLQMQYRQVTDRVGAAAERSGRTRSDVLMVAVTKYASPDQIQKIVEMGQVDLGESRAQQLSQRVPQLQEFLDRRRVLGAAATNTTSFPDRVRWHMVGQVQRNKSKVIAPLVDLIHSVDSLRLAEELHALGARQDRVFDILLQVNVSGEAGKGGVASPAVMHLAESIQTMLHLRLRGLMTMAPHSDDPEDARPTFTRCRELFEDLKTAEVVDPHFTVLSMGMSGDYEVAIEEGSNLVRVGRAIFGEDDD